MKIKARELNATLKDLCQEGISLMFILLLCTLTSTSDYNYKMNTDVRVQNKQPKPFSNQVDS